MKREKRNALRQAAIAALGGCCAACKLDDYHVLDIDHIHNDGGKERSTNAKVKMWKAIKNEPVKSRRRYQVLCANHNALKGRYPEIFAERFPHLAAQTGTEALTDAMTT